MESTLLLNGECFLLRGYFSGSTGWQNAFVWSVYVFSILFIFLPPIWVGVGFFIYVLAFGYAHEHVKLKKKEYIEGISFLDTLTVKGKKYSEPLLIGIRNHSEILIKPIDIEDNKFYQKAKEKYIRNVITQERFRELMAVLSSKTPYDDEERKELIEKARNTVVDEIADMQKLPMATRVEKLPPPSTFEDEADKGKKKKGRKKKEKLTEKEEKELEKKREKEENELKKKKDKDKIERKEKLIKEVEELLAEEGFDNDQLATLRVIQQAETDEPDYDDLIKNMESIDPRIPVDMNLNGFRAYDIELFEELMFADATHQTHKFNKMILVTPNSFEDTFHFSTMSLVVDMYPVRGKSAKCALAVLDWIDVNYPIMVCVWSEKETIDDIDFQIDANKIREIRETVMQGLIYEFRNYFKRFELQIEELATWSDTYYENWQRAIQFLYVHKNEWLENPANVVEDNEISVNKVWYYVLIGWGVISLLVIGVLLALAIPAIQFANQMVGS